ncbi:MAG: hypothetical protein R2828_26705 [Saprospiraceae bacterium]
MIGYIFFGFSLVFWMGLFFVNFSEPRMSGEGGMGYGLAIVALGLGFAISSLVLTISVANKGGFDWVGGPRFFIIGAGWLCMAAATFACVAFKWEWHEGEFSPFIRWLSVGHGQVWIPLLMFIPYFYLLNSELRVSVLPNIYKIPLMIGFVVSAMMSLGLLFGWLKMSAKQQQAQIEDLQNRDKKRHDEHLTYIAEQKPTDAILNIIALTGRFHDEDIRSAALAKIKEKPDWEDQLLKLLENEHYHTKTYTFLDGNKVDHPEKFLDPLNRSILRLADEIHKLIKDSNDLQDWHFEHFGIERLLRAIDEQFMNKGVDFRPAILKLQDALKTTPPERFKHVRFTVTPVVKHWLKKH